MALVNRFYWSAAAASAAGISQQVLRSWRMRKFIRFEGEGGHGRANYRRADICALRTMASLIAFGLDCETSAQIALLERLRSLFASADYDRHAQFGDEAEVIKAHDWTDPHRHHWVTVGYHDDGSPWLLEGGGHGREVQLCRLGGPESGPLILLDAAAVWREVVARLEEIEATADGPIGPAT